MQSYKQKYFGNSPSYSQSKSRTVNFNSGNITSTKYSLNNDSSNKTVKSAKLGNQTNADEFTIFGTTIFKYETNSKANDFSSNNSIYSNIENKNASNNISKAQNNSSGIFHSNRPKMDHINKSEDNSNLMTGNTQNKIQQHSSTLNSQKINTDRGDANEINGIEYSNVNNFNSDFVNTNNLIFDASEIEIPTESKFNNPESKVNIIPEIKVEEYKLIPEIIYNTNSKNESNSSKKYSNKNIDNKRNNKNHANNNNHANDNDHANNDNNDIGVIKIKSNEINTNMSKPLEISNTTNSKSQLIKAETEFQNELNFQKVDSKSVVVAGTSKEVRLIELIKNLSEKVKSYKRRINEHHCYRPISSYDEEEEEETVIEEITTRTFPIKLCSSQNCLQTVKSIENRPQLLYNDIVLCVDFIENISNQANDLIGINVLSELNQNYPKDDDYEAEKVNQTSIVCMNNISSHVNLELEPNNEIIREWFSEHDQTFYSNEQKTVIERLFHTFQTNRVEFVKLIIGLLAKNVKSMANQTEQIHLHDVGVMTNNTSSHSVACGDMNSINVNVVDYLNLINASVSAVPHTTTRFTSPIISVSHKSNMTDSSLNQHRAILTQSNLRQTNSFAQTDLEQINEISEYKDDGNQSSDVSMLVSKTINTTVPQISVSGNEEVSKIVYDLDNVKSFITPKYDDVLTRNRVAHYSTINQNTSGVCGGSGGSGGVGSFIQNRWRRNDDRYSTRNSRNYHSYSTYKPLSFSDSESSKLAKFNKYMRNTILYNPLDAITNTQSESISIDNNPTTSTSSTFVRSNFGYKTLI